jgi:4'-phosphopantetheinyl transferase
MTLYACFLRKSLAQKQHEAAHRLLSFAMKREYGIEHYNLGKGVHGKPFVEIHTDIKINLSHCNGLVVCAVGKNTIGADCERIRNVRNGVVRRAFTESEALEIENSANADLTFTRLWTLKESFVKAIGIGVSYPMKNAAFSISDNNTIYTNITGAFFRQWVIQDKYIISLCAAAPECETSLIFVSEKTLDITQK